MLHPIDYCAHVFWNTQRLKEDYPEIDFEGEYHFLEERSWSGYEESCWHILFHHLPTDRLMVLQGGYSVMAQDNSPPVFLRDIEEVSWEEWFDIEEMYGEED